MKANEIVAINAVLLHGQRLSNVAFNLKQRDGLPADIRDSCEECQKAFDAASIEMRRLVAEDERLNNPHHYEYLKETAQN